GLYRERAPFSLLFLQAYRTCVTSRNANRMGALEGPHAPRGGTSAGARPRSRSQAMNKAHPMDFMFEDEVDEVGSDVEAYCPKCKGDPPHVVISKYEDEIRRVQCNPCGDVPSYRKPRGDIEDDVPEPIAAKKRAMMKKLSWEEFFGKHSEKNAKPYEFREAYVENVIVTHPTFGHAFVSDLLSAS